MFLKKNDIINRITKSLYNISCLIVKVKTKRSVTIFKLTQTENLSIKRAKYIKRL